MLHLLSLTSSRRLSKKELENAKCVGLAHDGWTEGSEHYLSLYSSFMKSDAHIINRVTLRLLSCSVQEDIDEYTHFDDDLDENDNFLALPQLLYLT